MKSIPSSDIRILTYDELLKWGLWGDNVIAVELERNGLRDRCGENYTNNYYSAQKAKSKECSLRNATDSQILECYHNIDTRFNVSDGRQCNREAVERKCGSTLLAEYDRIVQESAKCAALKNNTCSAPIKASADRLKEQCAAYR